MGVTFEQPVMLLTALLAAPMAWAAWRWSRSMSRWRAVSAAALRAVLIALVAMMLAGASAVRETDRLAVIAVVDVSDSVRQFAAAFGGDRGGVGAGETSYTAAVRAWLEAADASRGPDDLLGLVAFDGSSLAVATPASGSRRVWSVDVRRAQGTDIAGALRFAQGLFPPDAARRIVLVSDGNETAGDALGEARRLSGGGSAGPLAGGQRVPVDVVPIAYRVRNEVVVERVDAPPNAAAESVVTVRVVLSATDATAGRLDLLYEGRAVDINGPAPGSARRVELAAGRNVLSIEVPLREGVVVHRFEPVFTPESPSGDRIASNNRAQTFTVTPGKGSVAVVNGYGMPENGPLVRALREAGIDLRVLTPAEVPGNLLELQSFDLVMLQNVPAEDLARPVHEALAAHVETLGAGLVMIGGPDSFGAGGWNGTALEPVLPVELDLPEQVVTPSAAVSFVIDSSGSMGQPVLGGSRSQQQVANEATALAIETLDRTDLVSVISFDSNYREVVPLGRNSAPGDAADRARRIAPGGGTNLYPALSHAGARLQAADASVKHVIVLSDGQSQGAPDEGVRVAERMLRGGVTVSTIAVGDGADVETLGRIAEAGGGQFYRVIDPSALPRIFIKEIRVVRRPLIREVAFGPVVLPTGSPLTRALPRELPPLGGLVLTQPRNEPLITNAMSTPEGEPLLAHWFVGRGQVAAWTSDASAWSSAWLTPGAGSAFGTLWTQTARTIARPATSRDYEMTTEVVGDELVIRLDAAREDGTPLDLLSVPGFVTLPDGDQREIDLKQVGPGAYEASTAATLRGNYVVALTPSLGERRLAPVVGGTSLAVGPEFRALRSNTALLRRVAETTGGRDLALTPDDAADLFDRTGMSPTRASLPLWPALLLWAVAIFVLDVGTRRVAWDRLINRELGAELRRHAREAARARSERAAGTVAALKKGRSARDAPASADGTAPGGDRERDRPRAGPAGAPTRDRAADAATAPTRAANPVEPERPAGEGQADGDGTTAGLLAAKRRARRRYGVEDDGQAGEGER